ncbi:MAG TPA: Re/Si-specific NAD(P)(+) transhydrogenase subunit alpha [Candidatus Eisenbacteria bacterium]|nr:Re/Si-specific NAD(P)(+) transhydrogenase subunit alpha [Candidatus Eisenbacteria bacterium]
MPTLFVPKEILPGETRVAATPETVKKLIKAGWNVTVESGAGAGANMSDQGYRDAGATVGSDLPALYQGADAVAKLHAPRRHDQLGKHEVDLLKPGTLLLSFLFPMTNLALVEQLRESRVTAFAMDQIPRITRAQSMDALSSQANLAGYKAVILGADHLPKIFPMLMTAAGTVPPARVVILGAGVAGLQAIATAKRLGAVVEVSDVRPAVKEQVQSLGGKFIEVETTADMETKGGYAKEASEEFLRKQRAVVDQHIMNADVVIGTAQVPGRPAPKLITAEVVEKMKPGAVIVDLAAENGGNCVLTEPGKVVTKHGVTIVGVLNVPSLMPVNASEVYARNILNVLALFTKDKQLNLDFTDEIVAGSVVVHAGDIKKPELVEALGVKTH